MLLFLGLAAAPEATDAQTTDYNRRWGEWMGALAAKGALVAAGPFQPHGKVVSSDGVTDLELDRIDIGAFALIEADSDEAANEIAGSTPHMELGGKTIVRPLVPLPPPA
jgi:uncharacterized protein YciI